VQYRPNNPHALTAEDLREILAKIEAPKVEFKLKYDLSKGSERDKRVNEIAKDILGLVNTAGRTADDYAYLVIGAGDKILSDGSRPHEPVASGAYNPKTLLDIVNARCTPEIPELLYREIELEGRQYGVIILPPSPHVHSLVRDLETPKSTWRKNSVILRSGEAHILASEDDIRLMRQQKQAWSVPRLGKSGPRSHVPLADILIGFEVIVAGTVSIMEEWTEPMFSKIADSLRSQGMGRAVDKPEGVPKRYQQQIREWGGTLAGWMFTLNAPIREETLSTVSTELFQTHIQPIAISHTEKFYREFFEGKRRTVRIVFLVYYKPDDFCVLVEALIPSLEMVASSLDLIPEAQLQALHWIERHGITTEQLTFKIHEAHLVRYPRIGIPPEKASPSSTHIQF
jgi:hypothetical protein